MPSAPNVALLTTSEATKAIDRAMVIPSVSCLQKRGQAKRVACGANERYKLFNVAQTAATEIPSSGLQIEKSLQNLFERNLDTLLGIRFLSSEYSTGPVHGGRIDTLGLDEDGSPVIIEYKRAMNENVINQGLFYLDWLLDHRREFQWLVMDVLGKDVADTVEWGSPRLLCIAGDFTRYDGHAVKQMARHIELLRYRQFGDGLLMLELVHAPHSSGRSASTTQSVSGGSVTNGAIQPPPVAKNPQRSDAIAYRLSQAAPDLADLWRSTVAVLEALGDDIQVKETKFYFAFRRITNFCCLELYPTTRTIVSHLKIDPESVSLEAGFTRDMRAVGHFGTGDLQVAITSPADLAKAQPLFQRAYDGG